LLDAFKVDGERAWGKSAAHKYLSLRGLVTNPAKNTDNYILGSKKECESIRASK